MSKKRDMNSYMSYSSVSWRDIERIKEVIGKQVRFAGRFDFVLTRINKRISMVKAKRDDINLGMADNVIGLEALSDVKDVNATSGVGTNFLHLVFASSKRCPDLLRPIVMRHPPACPFDDCGSAVSGWSISP
ncbi:hypothetical protein LEN26_004681 [Aphanomyces euteiches]|nr:hypothetical protein AeMF1_006814 [Aphanomyces euteiches]KAH9147668.1 hypothetical protein LEN26_004681 [Aphanomyces euteiches]KAH9160211.1 hypothetical protein AeNC1_019000 [Aphanomyces euteiches]